MPEASYAVAPAAFDPFHSSQEWGRSTLAAASGDEPTPEASYAVAPAAFGQESYEQRLQALQRQLEEQNRQLQALQQQWGRQSSLPSAGVEDNSLRPISLSADSAFEDCDLVPCEQVDQGSPFSLSYTGLYHAGAYSQNNFHFGRTIYRDAFVEQMLRLNVNFAAGDHLQAITRFDMGQGWWGVDNTLRSVNRGPAGSAGGSQLFDFKDTNFLFHVDHAYIQFQFPNAPWTGRIGRQWYGLGNRLMVDNNYDGVQFDVPDLLSDQLTFSWAKVSEGVDSLSDEDFVTPDSRGFTDARDAHLFMLNLHNEREDFGFTYDVYALNYTDRSRRDGNAYVPDHLQFFKTRFSPQITELTALGVAWNYTRGRFSLDGEFDYLWGRDGIANTTHEPAAAATGQLWDINNRELSGYNLFLKPSYAWTDRVKLGGIFGLGSGDSDVTSGRGNVNKLRTSGFFYMTEVWEDSVMPDEEGITPQGLGAPNVRGYRELENTTILQSNIAFAPQDDRELFFSYSYIRATRPVHAWTRVAGANSVVNPAVESQNLGHEVDARFTYEMFKNLVFIARGGIFFPGDAAGYLINGTNAFDKAAWEAKGHVAARF